MLDIVQIMLFMSLKEEFIEFNNRKSSDLEAHLERAPLLHLSLTLKLSKQGCIRVPVTISSLTTTSNKAVTKIKIDLALPKFWDVLSQAASREFPS